MDDKQKKSKKTDTSDSVKNNAAKKENIAQPSDEEKHGPLVEAAENIEHGAKVVGDKVTEVASEVYEKTSEIAGTVYDKVKDTVSDVVEVGTKAVEDLSRTAQNYIEKYKNKAEMDKIGEDRKRLTSKLGSLVFMRFTVKNMAKEDLFNDKEIEKLIKDIEVKDKEIVKIGKQIDQMDK